MLNGLVALSGPNSGHKKRWTASNAGDPEIGRHHNVREDVWTESGERCAPDQYTLFDTPQRLKNGLINKGFARTVCRLSIS